MARRALDAGEGVETPLGYGEPDTPLSQAVQQGHGEIVRLLLERGAQVDVRGWSGLSPLYWAAFGGKLEIARMLLEAGARVTQERSENEETSMHAAADKGDVDMLRLLLERGGGASALGVFDKPLDCTPLHLAIRSESVEAVQLLLEAGSDPDALSHITQLDTIGDPPLRHAVQSGNAAMVALLMQYGADPDRPGWWWNTARHDSEEQSEEIRQLIAVPPLAHPSQSPHRDEIERQLREDARQYGLPDVEFDWDRAEGTGEVYQLRGLPLQAARHPVGSWEFLALTVERELRAFWTRLREHSVAGIPRHVWDALTEEQHSWLPMDGRNQRWRDTLRRDYQTG